MLYLSICNARWNVLVLPGAPLVDFEFYGPDVHRMACVRPELAWP